MRLAPTVIALVAAGTLAARAASGQGITIDPALPSVADSVKVTVQSSFPCTGAWQLLATTCARTAPDTVRVTQTVGYCNGATSCTCAFFPTRYQRSCNFGPLPAGIYIAVFDEQHINPFDSIASFTRVKLFTVTGPAPVNPRTWGAVKFHHR